MKVLQINTVYGRGSTGLIRKSIHDECKKRGAECISAYRSSEAGVQKYEDSIEISSKWDSRFHGWWSRFTMLKGTGSVVKTWLFIKKVKKYNPDIVHLHNLHGSYVNIPILFDYLKKENIPVVWTFHDCWPFTAICSHFVLANCDKWEKGCHKCPQRKRFSSSPLDITPVVWSLKKRWFSGLEKVIIATPSEWMANNVKKSFLQEYEVKTIHNGINLNVFKETFSDFRKKYDIENKKIVLGVAFDWSYAKGLDIFIELSHRLSEKYKIVLVGTNEKVDKDLPDRILSIHRTYNQRELAEIYTAADVFVNPTREDTFPTVNMEALACGCPVVTFETGGSPESVDDTCGLTVYDENIDDMEQAIVSICERNIIQRNNCRKKAEQFDYECAIKNYIELYEDMLYKVKEDSFIE